MALNKLKFNSINVTPAASEAIRFNSGANGLETTSSFGGSLKKLSTTTLSSAASAISFTSGIDSTYKEYIFIANNIHAETNGQNFRVDFKDSSGNSLTKTTSFFMAYNNEAGSSDYSLEYDTSIDQAQSTSGAAISQFGFGGETADECGTFIVHLFEPSSTTFTKHFLATSRGMGYDSDQYTTSGYTGGYVNSTTAVTQASFAFNSGNIDAGTITMYGVT